MRISEFRPGDDFGVSTVEVGGARDVSTPMLHPPLGIVVPVPLVGTLLTGLLNVFASIRLLRGFRFYRHFLNLTAKANPRQERTRFNR